MILYTDVSAFVSALWPVVSMGLGFVLAVVLIVSMIRPFREWAEK